MSPISHDGHAQLSLRSRKEPMHSVLASSPVYPVFTACPPNTDAIQKKMQMLKLDKENTITLLSRLRLTRSKLRTDAGSWMRAADLPEEAKGDRGGGGKLFRVCEECPGETVAG